MSLQLLNNICEIELTHLLTPRTPYVIPYVFLVKWMGMSVMRHIRGVTRGVLHINKCVNTVSQMMLSDCSEIKDQID